MVVLPLGGNPSPQRSEAGYPATLSFTLLERCFSQSNQQSELAPMMTGYSVSQQHCDPEYMSDGQQS